MAKRKNFMERLDSVITENKIQCKCGHRIFMPVYLPHTICGWCGNIVFRNKEEEFKYKLSQHLRK